MKIHPDQEKKWEAMWKKWEKPLPQDSNDDIFADMKAAVPNWEKLVKKEFHGMLGAIDASEFENAIETVLDGEDPKSKKKFWDNCVTFDRFIDTVRYVVQNDYHKFNESEKVNETSFDQLDWKNGSLTGNGLKQAVDMFKAQDADKQTAVVYDRKSGQAFNIVDVSIGNMKSGHGLEIDIDTSKAIQKESDNMKDNKEMSEAVNDDGDEYVSVSELLYAAHKAVPNNSDAGKHTEIFAVINGKLELMKVGKFLKAKHWPDAGRFVLTDGSSASKAAIDKLSKQLGLDESELNEADDSDPLSHALDAVGVKASTANSKAQDEVQITATDGDTTAGIDVAIDRDIDAAMEEIYK